jgi:hypothetical protein
VNTQGRKHNSPMGRRSGVQVQAEWVNIIAGICEGFDISRHRVDETTGFGGIAARRLKI